MNIVIYRMYIVGIYLLRITQYFKIKLGELYFEKNEMYLYCRVVVTVFCIFDKFYLSKRYSIEIKLQINDLKIHIK